MIDRIKTAVLTALEELAQLGRTLHARRDDIFAWFDHRQLERADRSAEMPTSA